MQKSSTFLLFLFLVTQFAENFGMDQLPDYMKPALFDVRTGQTYIVDMGKKQKKQDTSRYNARFTDSDEADDAEKQPKSSIDDKNQLKSKSGFPQKIIQQFSVLQEAALNYPKTSLGIGIGSIAYLLGSAYKTNKKFRNSIHEKCEHCYYYVLDKLLPISFKWAEWEIQPLSKKDVLLSIGLYGATKTVIKLNAQYGITPVLSRYFSQFTASVQSGGKQLVEQAQHHKKALTYGLIGAGVFGALKYMHRKYTISPIYYRALLDKFMASLTSKQIEAIGSAQLIDAESNPNVLNKQNILKLLDEEQIARLQNIISEYKLFSQKVATA
jgi:hypothetical protein